MQTQTTTARTAPAANVVAQNATRYQPRAFGTGYGRSSGYAAPRSYSQSSTPSRFRFV